MVLSLHQSTLCLFHPIEVEVAERLVHECRDAVVAQVADGAFMGVMNVLVWTEGASLDVKADLLVGVSEG